MGQGWSKYAGRHAEAVVQAICQSRFFARRRAARTPRIPAPLSTKKPIRAAAPIAPMMMEMNCSKVRAADRKTALKTWIKARMMLR